MKHSQGLSIASTWILVLAATLVAGCPQDPVADAGLDASTPPSDAPLLDGGEPDAPPTPCDTTGAMRNAACGNCGLRSERCDGGVWVGAGPCIGEGECSAATTETRTSATCGEEARLCTDVCLWTAWDEVTPGVGDCEVGAMREVPNGCAPGVARVERCSSECAWEATATCADACGSDRRTEPAWAEERCVPAGPFIRGDDASLTARPEVEIEMSAYYIDRYPVTNLRYRACVDAAICSSPNNTDGAAAFADRSRDDYPVGGLTWAQAGQFCTWDGRALPTEAQWEKAMRGDASLGTPAYPWGDSMDCTRLNNFDCTAVWDGVRRNADRYDALPGTASPFGVEGLGLAVEWVDDLYRDDYYFTPASRLPDPVGPAPGSPGVTTARVVRSCVRVGDGWMTCSNTNRQRGSVDGPRYYSGVRCARTPSP